MEKSFLVNSIPSNVPLKILLLMFITGAGIMVLELAGSKMIGVHFGNTIYTWAAQIGVVLAALSIGYWYGGVLADQGNRWNYFYGLLSVASIWIMMLPFIQLFIPYLFYFGSVIGPLIASMVLFFFPVFVFAMVYPMSIKEVCKDQDNLGRVSGFLYGYSTIASIAGTFLSGFVLIPLAGIKFIFIGLGLAVFVVSVLFRKDLFSRIFFALPILVFLVSIQSTNIVFETSSPYYEIRVVDSDGLRTLYLDSDRHSAQKINSSEPEFDYVKLMLGTFDLASESNKVLVLGLGSGSMAQNILDNSNSTVDAVEIDPEVVKVAREYFGLKVENPRFGLTIGDARSFLRSNTRKYDLMLIDTYSSHYSIPFHLTTMEYFGYVNSSLSDDGLIVLNVISPRDNGIASYFNSTLLSVFSNVESYCPLNSGGVQNIVFIAWDHDWKAPGSIAGYHSCSVGSKAILTDDWAPVEYLVASSP